MRFDFLKDTLGYAWRAAAIMAVLPHSLPVAAQGNILTSPTNNFSHAPFQSGNAFGEAEFHSSGDGAVLTFRSKEGDVSVLRAVSDVKDALSILADRRLEFAWPALLAWAGSDLTILRDRGLQRAKVAFEAGLLGAMPRGQAEQWGGNAQLVAKLQYARSLTQSGRISDAIDMLKRSIAKLPQNSQAAYERQFLTVRLAGILFDNGDSSTAIKLIEQIMLDRNVSPDLMVNLEVNLSQYLVRSGHYERGLALINSTWERYTDQEAKEDSENVKIPDSEMQFAWIKACALRGLGKAGESKQMMSLIKNDASFSTNVSIADQSRLRAFACMNDPIGLALEISKQLQYAPPASDLFAELQPDSQSYLLDREVMARAIQQQSLTKSLNQKVALLDGVLAPAVREWR